LLKTQDLRSAGRVLQYECGVCYRFLNLLEIVMLGVAMGCALVMGLVTGFGNLGK